MALNIFNMVFAYDCVVVEGISTTKNLVIIILEHGSSPNMTYRFTILRREMESLVNPINKGAIGVRSSIEILSFWKA